MPNTNTGDRNQKDLYKDYQKKPITNHENNTRSIWSAKVIEIDDETDARRIKVKIPSLDDKVGINNLPWCYPLNPKNIDITPKEGEGVRILLPDVSFPYQERLWVGPVISQFENLKEEAYENSLKLQDDRYGKLNKGISTNPNAQDIYPKKEDENLLGRDNADIIFKKNKIIIRAGKHLTNQPLNQNNNNPAYIIINLTDNDEVSSTSIISDKLDVISHKGINRTDGFISNEEIEELRNENMQSTVYGDNLRNLLNLMIKFMINHSHSYNGESSIEDELANKLQNFDLDSVLNNNFKTS